MARNRNTAPPPMPDPEPANRGLLSRWDRIFLIVCLAIMLFIGMKQCGFNMVSRTEKIEMTDDPHK